MKTSELNRHTYFPFLQTFRSRAIALVLLSILLNLNTVRNEYALDDEMVIGSNMNVHLGAAGLGKIFTTDAYQGFFDYLDAASPLSGGRYRPLSIATFAVEEQLFSDPLGNEYLEAKKAYKQAAATGSGIEQVEAAAKRVRETEKLIRDQTLKLAPVRHFMQVVYYALAIFVLFLFLHGYLLNNMPDVAFVASLLFVLHPIHTEVTANLKSRDEIFSLLFILLTCIYAMRYHASGKNKDLVIMSLSGIAALLSKEYAVILPAIALCGIAVTSKEKITSLLTRSWFIVLSSLSVVLMIIRYSLVLHAKKTPKMTDPLNDPYLFADLQQKIATKTATLIEYAKLLVWPHPLSSDYSYSHFPYLGFTDLKFWISLLFWAGVVFITIRLWQKKHILSFALIFFLAFFMLINNMLFAIGATMGERLIFHSSAGFCIIAGWLMVRGADKMNTSESVKKGIFAGVLILLCAAMGYKTIARNADWKNDYTLFTRDVKYVSNSALTNGNAGGEIYNKALLDLKNNEIDSVEYLQRVIEAKGYLSRALAIHPRHVNSYLNRAICHMALGKTDSAISDWKAAAKNFNGRYSVLTGHAKTVLSMGRDLGSKKNYAGAAKLLRDAVEIDPGNPEIWNNLAGSEFMLGRFTEASYAFRQALSLNPNIEEAKRGATAADNFVALQNRCRQDSLNPKVWEEAAQIYRSANFPAFAEDAEKKAAALRK